MKLRDNWIVQQIEDRQFMVSTGGFSGIVRNNATAAYIVNCLKSETTPEQIIDAMTEKYDAPRERIAQDVEIILDKLRGIGALDE